MTMVIDQMKMEDLERRGGRPPRGNGNPGGGDGRF